LAGPDRRGQVHRRRGRQTVDSPEVKAWNALPIYKARPLHPLYAAMALARAAARDELRARWADEDKAEAAVDLPAHITRLTEAS
jgi:hypothetical protein